MPSFKSEEESKEYGRKNYLQPIYKSFTLKNGEERYTVKEGYK